MLRHALLLLLLSPASANDWRAGVAAADKAYRAKDWAASKEHLLELYEPMSGHPSVVYGLARAEGQLGNLEAAIKWLRQFVAMGITRDITKDPDLEPLRKHAAFPAIAAEMQDRQKPVGNSKLVARLPDADLLTEDIAWDAKRGKFLVTSIHKASVLLVGKDGRVEPLIANVLPPGWGFLGVATDPNRNTLWVTAAAMEGTTGFDKALNGMTALYAFDLTTGKLRRRYDAPEKGSWGELLLLDDGSILLSNSQGSLDILKPAATAVEPFLAKGELASPQSVAARGDVLYVADYVRGLAVVNRKTRAITLLPHPPELCVQSIDGLYLDGQSLIAIQNGSTLSRIVRMNLDPAGTRIIGAEILESKTTSLGSPTHGVFVDGRFYHLANTGWDRVEGGIMKPGEPAEIRLCQVCESRRR